VSSAAEAGNLKLVKGNWIGQFLDEAESFPAGEHDDAIDSLSGAHAALTSGRRIFAV
jgi:predicted phage terminase large subunit-like protein